MSFHVLTNFHHTDLYRSLVRLFEGRLGGKVYRPFGQGFYERGYFFNGGEKESRGLLTKENFNPDTWALPLNVPSHYPYGEDWRDWNWITLEEVSDNITHILISSSDCITNFKKLQREVCPKAKLWRYVGNEDEVLFSGEYDLVLSADKETFIKNQKKENVIRFHPEISPVYLTTKKQLQFQPIIRNFLNFFHTDEGLSNWAMWEENKKIFEDQKFLYYKHGLKTPPFKERPKFFESFRNFLQRVQPDLVDRANWPDLLHSDGEPTTHDEIARLLAKTSMIWHYKRKDGFGYMLHQAAAMGVPPIIGTGQYNGKTAGEMLVDRETCVEVVGGPTDHTGIHYAMIPEVLTRMGERLRERFLNLNDYESEARTIQNLL